MRKRDFNNDDKGQAFSLDVMMALIIITVIIGVSANAMDMVSYKAQDYSARHSLERVTTDAADILIKSSGSPDEWEKYYYSSSMTPGLAKKDILSGRTIPNTLTFRKINKLASRYDEMMPGKVLPDGVNSAMYIYPANSSLSVININNKTVPANATEVAVANRTVLCDFMYVNIVIGMNAHRNPAFPLEPGYDWENCTHKDPAATAQGVKIHLQPVIEMAPIGKPGWACHHFNVTKEDLNTTDFYIITDPRDVGDNSPKWLIDRPEAMSDDGHDFGPGSAPILINSYIASALGTDDEAVLWLHIYTPGDPKRVFDGYIISVPKGTPQDQVDLNYLNPQPAFFVLKTWY